MRRSFSVFGAAAVVLVLLHAPAAWSKDIVLGYMPASMIFPYSVATAKGFREQAEELGVRAIIIDPHLSVEEQSNGVDDFLAQGVDGIAVLAVDGLVAQTWVDKAAEAGVPFVSVATQVGDWETRKWSDVYPNLSALVGMDNVHAGVVAGEIAAKVLPKDRKAKIAIIEGAPGFPQVPQRTEGFLKSLDASGLSYEIVASQPTDWTAEQGDRVCQNLLTAHPDLDLFFAQADPGAVGCSIAVRSAGADVSIVSGDGGSKDGAAAIAAGDVVGSVCDRPEYQGRLAAKALYDAITDPKTPKARLIGFDNPATTIDTLADCPPEY